MDIQKLFFSIAQSLPGFLLAITAHEWAHARMAKGFGDDTAEREGRLSLNPAVHLDAIGTFILPIICLLLGGAIFGYAKPVPVNIRNFKNIRKGMFWVSFAGPLINIILGVLSSLTYAIIATQLNREHPYFAVLLQMLSYSIFINFLLAVFNLIPFPPLDGSKMVASFLKGKTLLQYEGLVRYSNYIFLGIFALSLMGVSTLGHILAPAQILGQKLTMYFLYLLG